MTMFNPPHPGGLITEYIEDNNIGLRVLAKELGVSAAALSKVASGKASVSPEMAVRLEAGLGIAARLWLSMQAACDLHKAREKRMFPACICIRAFWALPHKPGPASNPVKIAIHRASRCGFALCSLQAPERPHRRPAGREHRCCPPDCV